MNDLLYWQQISITVTTSLYESGDEVPTPGYLRPAAQVPGSHKHEIMYFGVWVVWMMFLLTQDLDFCAYSIQEGGVSASVAQLVSSTHAADTAVRAASGRYMFLPHTYCANLISF